MPTYVYRREDGTTFELEQRITAPALTVDPETGQAVQRVITGAGLVFKGSGFYLTDYARKGSSAAAPESGGSAAKSSESASSTPPASTGGSTPSGSGSSSGSSTPSSSD